MIMDKIINRRDNHYVVISGTKYREVLVLFYLEAKFLQLNLVCVNYLS